MPTSRSKCRSLTIRPYAAEACGLGAEERLDGLGEPRLQRAGGLGVGEDVVGRDAGLPGVEELAACEPLGDLGQVGAAVDERR